MFNYKIINSFLLCFSLFFITCTKSESNSNSTTEPPITDNSVVQVTKLNDNVRLLVTNYKQPTNMILFTGTDGILLIDTGYPSLKDDLQSVISQVSIEKLKYIINTHIHYDHTGGNSKIDSDGTIIGSINALSELQALTPGIKIESVNQEYSFTFNGEDIKCYSFENNGHTKNDIMVYFQKSKLLFTGDAYLSQSFPSVNSRNGASVQNCISNLKSIADLFPNDVTLIPGHGKPTTMEEYKDYIAMIEKTVSIIRAEMSKKSLPAILSENLLNEWYTYGTFLAGEGLTTNYWITSIYESYYRF